MPTGDGQIALEELFQARETRMEVPLQAARGNSAGVFRFNVREHVEDATGGTRGTKSVVRWGFNKNNPFSICPHGIWEMGTGYWGMDVR